MAVMTLLFYFLKVIYFRFVETIFKMKLNSLVTKYKDILTFNFAYIIYHTATLKIHNYIATEPLLQSPRYMLM